MAEQKKIGRRSFFAGLGLAAAAGITAKLASQPASSPAAAAPQQDAERAGYRLTEHIQKYYRTTTI